MCHGRNVMSLVGPKKTLRTILDQQPNVRGICAPFPNCFMNMTLKMNWKVIVTTKIKSQIQITFL